MMTTDAQFAAAARWLRAGITVSTYISVLRLHRRGAGTESSAGGVFKAQSTLPMRTDTIRRQSLASGRQRPASIEISTKHLSAGRDGEGASNTIPRTRCAGRQPSLRRGVKVTRRRCRPGRIGTSAFRRFARPVRCR